MTKKLIKSSGWVLTIVLALLFAMSASLKITQDETAVAQAAAMGIGAGTYRWIGIVEVISLILFVVPRTGVVGALLLIAYMGGAIATHLQHQQPVAMAVTVQVLLWIAVAMRFPELIQRLFSGGKQPVVQPG